VTPIKVYSVPDFHAKLGEAELTIGNDLTPWDVSNMTFNDMITTYEPEIRTAKKAVLSSSEIGTWHYEPHEDKWRRGAN